ncbi:unnamed protein product, partial [Iphiclides podalirius]
MLFREVSLDIESIETIHELDSDHMPVLCKLGQNAGAVSPTKSVVDWHRLEVKLKALDPQDLVDLPETIATFDDANRAIVSLRETITSAVTDSERTVKLSGDRRFNFPPDLRQVIRQKNAAKRAFDRYRSESNRTLLRRLQLEVKDRISEHRHTTWDNLLEDIEPSHTAYWRLARSLKADPRESLPPLVRPNSASVALDDSEKAECLADNLEQQCTPSREHTDTVHLTEVDRVIETRAALPPEGEPLNSVTPEEVQDIIKNLKPKSAPGPDNISNKILKALPGPLICLLATIYNTLLSSCSFPDDWKEATVIGIRKPNKPANQPSSYRPISLLSCLGKLYERLLLNRLNEHVFTNGLLPAEQFGFRARHSCPDQLFRLTEHILKGLNHPKHISTGALFFDIAKAFDKVWHNGLLYKLYTRKCQIGSYTPSGPSCQTALFDIELKAPSPQAAASRPAYHKAPASHLCSLRSTRAIYLKTPTSISRFSRMTRRSFIQTATLDY